MENLEKNRIKTRMGRVVLLFLILLVFVSLGVSLYFNETLQLQINERNVLIEDLTRSDSILKQIMDFEYDSVNHSSSYSYRTRDGRILKYNELARDLDESEKKYEQISLKHSKILNDNNKDLEDFNTIVNDYNSLSQEYNSLLKSYKLLIGDYNEIVVRQRKYINDLNQVSDSLSSFKIILRLIQKDYNISYSINTKGDIKSISVKSDKVDSALVLLPFFRDRLKLDREKGMWEIKTNK